MSAPASENNESSVQTRHIELGGPVLAAIVLAYLLIGAMFATQTPPWQVPDEPAHYNYIRQLIQEEKLPVISGGDYDAEYLEALKSQRFSEAVIGKLWRVQYEDHQPPLYYVLIATMIRANERLDLVTMRLFSLLFGGVVVWLVGVVLLNLFPTRRIWALTAAAFAAFLPQHVAILAGLNNDALAFLIVNAALFAGVILVRDGRPHPLIFGILAGAAWWIKITAAPVVATITATALIVRWQLSGEDRRRLVWTLAWAALLTIIIAGGWWARNLDVYGGLDIMGLGAHDAVVIGQPRTAEWIAQNGLFGWFFDWIATTFRSFWGQFGWMALPMQDWVYWALLGFTAVVIGGWATLWSKRRAFLRMLCPRQIGGLVVLGAALLVTLAEYVYYNLTFVQFQGRYLFPAMVPLALIAAVGLWGAVRAVRKRFGLRGNAARLLEWLPLAVVVLLAGLDLLVLRWYIPTLAP